MHRALSWTAERAVKALSEARDRIGRRLYALTPPAKHARRRNEAARARGLTRLAAFSEASSLPRFGRVLVDGQWDNANYWLRYALFRKALSLGSAREVGLLGQHNRERVAAAFSAFGFAATIDHGRHVGKASAFLGEARRLLANTRQADDIHRWTLPGWLPTTIMYDGILKRQRRGEIDLSDPNLPAVVAEALSAMAAAERVIEAERPDLLVMSHVIDFSYGALAWSALARGIPVVALYGDYGTNRFIRLCEQGDLFSYPSRPTIEDQAALAPATRAALAEAGRMNLLDRIDGRTSDVSAIYAFRRRRAAVDRALLGERFGWDPSQPVIGVYAPNWFDYPNGSGRFPFRDFRAWTDVTLAAARANPAVNWLFKAHPCDEWYGSIRGPRLADIVAAANMPQVRLCDTSWNGRALLDLLDGLVTVHGTAGLEAAVLGKPVLVPYAGWYGAFGFAEVPASADAYIARLSERWWEGRGGPDVAVRAAAFAGWYFCAPKWHEGWFLEDDANQDAIWWDLDAVLSTHAGAIAREVEEIGDWMADGHRYYQIFKMRRATGFVPACARVPAHTRDDRDPRQRQFAAKASP